MDDEDVDGFAVDMIESPVSVGNAGAMSTCGESGVGVVFQRAFDDGGILLEWDSNICMMEGGRGGGESKGEARRRKESSSRANNCEDTGRHRDSFGDIRPITTVRESEGNQREH